MGETQVIEAQTIDAQEPEVPQGKTVHQKLLELRKSVSYLQKENDAGGGGKYQYVSSSQTLAAVRAKMDELGLLLLPAVTNGQVHLGAVYGGKMHLTELQMTYAWVDADNPEDRIECPWYGQGVDDGEKGVGKALTYAEKYLLWKTLQIATDKDDPDAFAQKHEPAPPPAPPAPTHDDAGRPLNMRECYKMLLPLFGGDKDNATAAVRVAANALYETTGDQWQTLEGEKCAALYDRVKSDAGGIAAGSDDDPFPTNEEA